MSASINLCILGNEENKDHQPWIDAIENSDILIDYQVVDLTDHDWLEKVSGIK